MQAGRQTAQTGCLRRSLQSRACLTEQMRINFNQYGWHVNAKACVQTRLRRRVKNCRPPKRFNETSWAALHFYYPPEKAIMTKKMGHSTS